MRATERRRLDKNTVDAFSHRHRKRSVQVLERLHGCSAHLNAEFGAGNVRSLQERTVPRRRGGHEYGEARGVRDGFLQYFQRLHREVGTQTGQTRDVPAWPREACHVPETDRVGMGSEDYGDRVGRLSSYLDLG